MTALSKMVLKKGATLVGKWKGNSYVVEKLLGEGANGKVYLVSQNWSWYALKIGANSIDLQSEINALKALEKRSGTSHAGYLKDVDDCLLSDGKEYPFYTMRYVKGQNMSAYMNEHGVEWFSLLALNLLRRLGSLHAAGFVFGDLKVENIMVSDYGQVELIDYGGASLIGKSVKQFTELYDRGYWNSGTRSADPAYDLFSFSVLCVQLFAPRKLAQLTTELLPQQRSVEHLMDIVKQTPGLAPYEGWLLKAFHGHFLSGQAAAEGWRTLAHRRKVVTKSNHTPRWLKILIALSVISVCAMVSLFVLDYHGFIN